MKLFAILTLVVVSCDFITSLDVQSIDCKAVTKLLKLKTVNDVYLPHEDDCESFYRCGAGGAAKIPCGIGTIFSQRNKDCRRPEDTKCILLDAFLKKKNVKLEDFYNEDY